MSKIKRIIIKNFRGFGDKVTFEFEEKALVLLFAPNGSGKTSLLDAIEWCLTGDIKRLHSAYLERNSTSGERNLKLNSETILKNKKHLNEDVEVIVEAIIDDSTYIIKRVQSQDTLDDPGKVSLSTKSDDNSIIPLDEIIDGNNFYKYHICDMQKTYRFLSTGRKEMNKEFIDFSTNFDDAECLVENLVFFSDDIDKKIKKIENQKIPDNVINGYLEQLNIHKNFSEIFPYATEKLYPNENVNPENMDEGELKQQLLVLQGIGYKKAVEILEKKKLANEAVKNIENLESLEQEYKIHKQQINEAIVLHADRIEVRQKAEDNLAKIENLKLTATNLEANSEAIIAFNSNHFTRQYWDTSCKEVKITDNAIQNIKSEIEVLTRGNAIIEILTTIAAGKENLIAYRNQEKKKGSKVLCPVCGSEKFGLIDEADVAKQAQCYQAEHMNLIEEKKKVLNELETKRKGLVNEQFEKAVAAKNEAIESAKATLYQLTSLYNDSKQFFDVLHVLQSINEECYSISEMSSEEGIEKAKKDLEKSLISKDSKIKYEKELEQIFSMMKGSYDKAEEPEKIMMEIMPKADLNPEGANYNRELLSKKITSIRSYMDNLEWLKISKLLKQSRDKNNDCEKQIEELKTISEKADKYKKNIQKILKKLREEEFEQVGPYLYKIFRKLSRNIKIEGLNLRGGKKDGQLSLTDEDGKSVLNMFSDGQLSVFMLSYFFGNALRIKGKEKFPIYFIDDITSCMDDINMLAFLDFIKYQLSNDEGAFEQLFFATCDSRIQDMICWKMDSCEIPYKRVSMNEF